MRYYYFKYISYFVFFLGLFFGGRFAVNAIGLFMLINIIDLFINGTKPLKEFPKLLLLPIAFYGFHIISSLYSSNSETALFDLEVKFSFVALPLLFGFQRSDHNINLLTILRLFLSASIFAGIYLLITNLIYYQEHHYFATYMLYSKFLHPSYLSMYFSFSILLGVFLFTKKSGNKFCIISAMLVALANIYFAESKAALITGFILTIYLVFKIINSRYRLYAAIFSLIIAFAFGIFAKSIHRFASIGYVFEHLQETMKHPEDVEESTALRVLVWSASIDVIKKNPILGVGNGDIHTELSKVYKERNIKHALMINMNAHNQYLETAIGQGVIGLLLLLIMLITPLFISNNTLLIQGFIILIAFNILVESMFNTQAGVLFIAFFYSFLISQSSSKTPYYEDSIFLDSIE